MKVMFYINTIGFGGAERVLVNLANTFALDGAEVVLVTSFSLEQEYKYNNLVKRFSLEEEDIEQSWVKKNIDRTRKLRKLCRTEKPDVLVSFMGEANFRAILACMGLKVKNLISVRNDPNREYGSTMFRVLAKTLFRFADGTVFQTEDAKKWFPKAIQKRSRVIYNQVAECFYTEAFTGKRQGIVTTGRLVKQKNHRMLIEAFSIVANVVEDNLYIYGQGELGEELQKSIDSLGMTNRIFLMGTTSDVAKTIKSAKAFVLSSDYEGMPNSLMEALALGIPCISTDCPCGGPRMLIENEANGLLVPVGDIQNMSNAILSVLTDEVRAGRMGEQAMRRAEEYRAEKVFASWKEYISILAR